MKKTVLFLTLIIFSLSCGKDTGTALSGGCNYNGHPLNKGASGGCYYTNSSGNKVYVDRSYCNCL
ncbi:hypothetical protein [Chitinophaga pinensis]|uniref:Lipoprotein n=1 Tax=Chitinophaga pinensis TaxID=79329 RepID=A0A5C6LVW6_9BACT|nr:hypothetical protein [Chitinophaga pinensis]TWW00728.1 hypothetical protein FEF09_09510 [Chitinophaga pinensis]